ncbi:MAG: hypothetical protein ACE5Q6_07935 [Dehalococcoidia bacterium]
MAEEFVVVTGLTELQAKLTNSKTIGVPLRKLLSGIAEHLKGQVQSNMPVDTGAAKESVVVTQDTDSLPRWAKVSSPLDYVAVLEEGSGPHWPDIESLEPWARRHGFASPRRGAFMVARAIARRGTKAHRMFARAVEQSQGQIDLLVSQAGKDIVDKLDK